MREARRLTLAVITTTVSVAVDDLAAQTFLPIPAGTPAIAFANPDEAVSTPIPLGFGFPGPAGVINTIEVTTNGRIAEAGSLTPDFTPMLAELFAGPPTLCPLWADLVSPTVFFHVVPSPLTAVITWQNSTVFGGMVPFTVQAQLRAVGQIDYVYEGVPNVRCLVGYGKGGGAPANEVDLSLAASEPVCVGQTAFEDFLGPPGGPSEAFDFAGLMGPQSVRFTPCAPDSTYVVAADKVAIASVQPGRKACVQATEISFQHGAIFGYGITNAVGVFDNEAIRCGLPLGLGDDATSTQPLSFAMTLPGGGATSSIVIDSNGRVMGVGGVSDDTPTVAELFSDPFAQYCPLWRDLDPSAGGEVFFYDDCAGTATVTWCDVPSFGGTDKNTFQVAMSASGDFVFRYLAVEAASGTTLVGVGHGVADLEGPVDFTMPMSSSDEVVHEVFVGPTDLSSAGPSDMLNLVALSDPIIGGPVVVDVIDKTAVGIPFVVYFVGFPAGVLAPPLTVFFSAPGCQLLVDVVTPGAAMAFNGTPGVPASIATLPPSPALVGYCFSVAALGVRPGPLMFFPTDELVMKIGL